MYQISRNHILTMNEEAIYSEHIWNLVFKWIMKPLWLIVMAWAPYVAAYKMFLVVLFRHETLFQRIKYGFFFRISV